MNRIVQILMERDGQDEKSAWQQYDFARECVEDAIASGDYFAVQDIMQTELGLEEDYIFDLI